jgi:hypothetical protein
MRTVLSHSFAPHNSHMYCYVAQMSGSARALASNQPWQHLHPSGALKLTVDPGSWHVYDTVTYLDETHTRPSQRRRQHYNPTFSPALGTSNGISWAIINLSISTCLARSSRWGKSTGEG